MKLLDLETLTPEQRILINAIRVSGATEFRIHEQENVDWELVQSQAVHHRVVPLLYAYLKCHKESDFPVEKKEQLRMLYLANVARNQLLTRQLFELITTLGNKGIHILPYKGPFLAFRAYGDMARRFFIDLDLFVRSRDFPLLYREITRDGYRPMIRLSDRQAATWGRFGREFMFTRGKAIFDIHMRIAEGPNFLSVDKTVWPNRLTVEVESLPMPMLSPEDLLLVLCVHGAKHGWQYLGMVADVAHLVASHPELDWEKIAANSKQWGCRTMLGVALTLSRKICGLELTDHISAGLMGSSRIRRQSERFIGQIFSGSPVPGKFRTRLLQLTEYDSVWKNLRNLGYYLFAPKTKDLLTFSLPVRFHFFYYILRPLRIFSSILAGLFKKFQKRSSDG